MCTNTKLDLAQNVFVVDPSGNQDPFSQNISPQSQIDNNNLIENMYKQISDEVSEKLKIDYNSPNKPILPMETSNMKIQEQGLLGQEFNEQLILQYQKQMHQIKSQQQ